jgi:uncharacterized protein (TIGR01244 family)
MNTRPITSEITIGGQPSVSDLDALQTQGFRTIVNLRTENENGYFAEEEHEVEHRGFNYAEIPVSPELLDDMAMQRFSSAIDSDDSPPIYVHCAGGGRAGVLTLLHLAVKNGWKLEEALETGGKLGIAPKADSPYRTFFEDYIKRHSAGER